MAQAHLSNPIYPWLQLETSVYPKQSGLPQLEGRVLKAKSPASKPVKDKFTLTFIFIFFTCDVT